MALVTSVPFLFQFNSSMGPGHAQPLGMGSGVRTPQHFYWPPLIIVNIFLLTPNFKSGQSSCMFVWNVFFGFHQKVDYFKMSISNYFRIYTPEWLIWSSKFQKIAGEGLTGPPPQTPSPLFLGFCSRFGLRPIQTPDFWRVVVHYHAWGRDLQMLMSSIRWMNAQKLSI